MGDRPRLPFKLVGCEGLERRVLFAAADLDPSFGTGGVARADVSGVSAGDYGTAVARQLDGKIVVGGYAGLDFPSDGSTFAVSRYNPDGSLDTTFGTGGVVRTHFDLPGIRDAGVNAIAIQPDGKIVAAGSTLTWWNFEYDNDFALARYNPDGSLDTTFGDGGKVVYNFGGPASYDHHSDDRISDLAIRPDGRIVVAGTVIDYWADVGLAQFNPNGTLDTTFGDQGKLRHTVGYAVRVNEMELLPDGKVLIAGQTRTGNVSFDPFSVLLARYTPQGQPDPSFGVGGVRGQPDVVGVTVDSVHGASANDLAVDPADGSIYVVAHVPAPQVTWEERPGTNYVIKYTAGGRRVPDFGNGGLLYVAEGGDGVERRSAIELYPGGMLAVALTTGMGTGPGRAATYSWTLARVSTAGALDLTFSPTGAVTHTVQGSLGSAWLNDLAVLPGGGLLVVGGDFRDTVLGKVVGGSDALPGAGIITGLLYNDTDRNGRRDTGEAPVAGQSVYLDADDDGVRDAGEAVATSGADGRYTFRNLGPGTHVLRTALTGTWNQTGPASNGAYRWRLNAGGGLGGADFGLIQLPKITLYSYRDDNVNGQYDPGELPLDGQFIYADTNNNGRHDTGEPGQTTAANGTAVFEVTPGTYRFRHVPSSGFVQTGAGDVYRDVTTTGDNVGSFAGPYGFGAVNRMAVGRVSGMVFSDTNGDGIKQSSESGIWGGTVYIDADNDGALDAGEATVTTLSNGSYEFRNLLPGTYTFRVRVPHGAEQTLPASGQGLVLNLRGGDTLTSRNFAYRFPPQQVLARHVLYNNSAFDGRNPAANAGDDGAIATDKRALLPGQQATFDNVTSYTRGINGVMIDLAYLPESFRDEPIYFEVKAANPGTNPVTWRTVTGTTVSHRLGAGVGGSDRVTLTWPDGAIKDTWLRIVVIGGGGLGLAQNDVFYFGNLSGETGDSAAGGAATVTPLDLVRVRRAMFSEATIDSPYDLNRDGRVSPLDFGAARAAQRKSLPLLTAPSTLFPPPAGTASADEDEAVSWLASA